MKINLPDPIKAGISTAIITFVGMSLLSVTNFLSGLYGYTSSSGHTPLPSISTLGYALGSAALAAILGLGTTIFRWLQSTYSFVPGKPPVFQGGK